MARTTDITDEPDRGAPPDGTTDGDTGASGGPPLLDRVPRLGVFAWSFVGAVVALLFAPVTGKKMQKKIAVVNDHILSKVEETVDDVQASVRRIAKA